MTYIGGVLGSLMTTLFFVFLIAAVGYLIGGIEIKGISLGTAGVLLTALVFGIIAHYVGSFTIGGHEIVLYNTETVKPLFGLISNIGTALFVTAIGLIAGPKFFRSFNKKFLSYILMGVAIIATGFVMMVVAVKVFDIEPAMASGLLTGALTSTPGLSAAKEAVGSDAEALVTAGYGIAYLFGVFGVVLFVQIMPRILRVDIAKERENFVAANTLEIKPFTAKVKRMDPLNFFAFVFTVAFGMILGSIKIPGINFSLGTSGGTLIAGLIVGHFGHIGKIDMRFDKEMLNIFRELGLMLFLIGAGVPAGVNFVNSVEPRYFLVGIAMTLVPMIIGFILAKYVFKLSIFNNLGSITGGMTSTPALGTLISVAGTDEVAAAYASTYPIALVLIVLAVKLVVLL
ncbi:MAG: YidE/YbjL duplication [Candidatus Avispirillum sp.]